MNILTNKIEDDPLWYKDAIFYEVYVRGFYDSNADGIGDFRGLVRLRARRVREVKVLFR